MQIGEIGKGVAQRRKQLGLSQEELAQQLHVTRQAVSKWESGTALPSVDNIVMLSRILKISVDELLQLPHEEREPVLSAQSVGRLLDEQSLRQEKRIRRLTWMLAAAVIVLVAGITLSTVLNITRTSRMAKNVQQQNQQILSTIASMQDSMVISVRNALIDGSTRLTDGGCRAFDYVHSEQAVYLQVFAYPQELTEPHTAQFYALLSDGSRITAEAGMVRGGFEGTLVIPDNNADYLPVAAYVSWQENDETVTEKILDQAFYLDGLRLRLTDFSFDFRYEDNGSLLIQPRLSMYVPAERADCQPVSVKWEIDVRGKPAYTTESACICEDGTFFMTVSPEEGMLRLDSTVSPDDITVRASVTDAGGNVFLGETTGP